MSIQYDETLTNVKEKCVRNASNDTKQLKFHIKKKEYGIELLGKQLKIRYVLAVLIHGKYEGKVTLNKSVSCLYTTGKYSLNGVTNKIIHGNPVSTSDEKVHDADVIEYNESIDKTVAIFHCFSKLPDLHIKEEYTELGNVDIELTMAERYPQLSNHEIKTEHMVLFPMVRYLSCSFDSVNDFYKTDKLMNIIEHLNNKKSE